MAKRKAIDEETRELFKSFADRFGLVRQDFFELHGVYIITRRGIEKIARGCHVSVTLEPVPEFTNVSEDKYCIKATARTLEGEKVETFGESSGKNTRIAYPISIAEKRAKARAVLQISKLYSLPVHSEDEADEFQEKS